MKICKIIICTMIYLVSYDHLFSQTMSRAPLVPSSSVDSLPLYKTPSISFFNGFKVHRLSTNVQLGSFFTATSGFGSSFSTYISPNFSYALSPRFRISAGMTIINTQLMGIKPLFQSEQSSLINGNLTNTLIYVCGEYLVNDRLKVSGTLYKQFNVFNTIQNQKNLKNFNAQGAYMKVDYKVFENFHIQAGFGYSKGMSPYNSYFRSPYNNSYSPFITDPFTR